MKNIEVSISEAALNKIKETVTIDQIDKDIPIGYHLSDICNTYSHIIKCGLRDFNRKLTWNEILYMLASINGTFYHNTETTFTVESFICTVIDFEVYEKEQTEKLGVNGRVLADKLQMEHPISCVSLLTLLHQCWVVCSEDNIDFKEYIEHHLRLKK
jgi:hypothetical protein